MDGVDDVAEDTAYSDGEEGETSSSDTPAIDILVDQDYSLRELKESLVSAKTMIVTMSRSPTYAIENTPCKANPDA